MATHVTCSIFRSIPVNRHRCRFCIDHEWNTSHRMSEARIRIPSIRDCTCIAMTRRFRLAHNRGCRELENSWDRSNAFRKCKSPFRGRNVRDPSSPASIDRPAGLEPRNLRPASPPCRSIDRIRSYRDRSTLGHDSRLMKEI